MANFAASKGKKVKGLVKNIGLLFLLVLSMVWIGQQEKSELQEAVPQAQRICTIVSGQSTAERAFDHLFTEQMAIPALTAGEIPGYHPQHSKPKCLHTNIQKNRYAISFDKQHTTHQTLCLHHVIDYYIYTLEHILI